MYQAFSKKGRLFKGGHYLRGDIIKGNTAFIFKNHKSSGFIVPEVGCWMRWASIIIGITFVPGGSSTMQWASRAFEDFLGPGGRSGPSSTVPLACIISVVLVTVPSSRWPPLRYFIYRKVN